jgi:hypothetical protein
MQHPDGPGAGYVWDMSICHTWYYVRSGMGNVPQHSAIDPTNDVRHSNLWDGDNPPPGSLKDCGYDLFGFPIHC